MAKKNGTTAKKQGKPSARELAGASGTAKDAGPAAVTKAESGKADAPKAPLEAMDKATVEQLGDGVRKLLDGAPGLVLVVRRFFPHGGVIVNNENLYTLDIDKSTVDKMLEKGNLELVHATAAPSTAVAHAKAALG